jgi:hypothetical protein
LADWLKEKKLKYAENIVERLENAPKDFIGLFAGENLGKQLVKVVCNANGEYFAKQCNTNNKILTE